MQFLRSTPVQSFYSQHTNSTPMTPAPITMSSSGTFLRDKAPVEDTTLSSSICYKANLKFMSVTDKWKHTVDKAATGVFQMYLDSWERCDLWSSSDEDVLRVYNLISISGLCRHLILTSYRSNPTDVSNLQNITLYGHFCYTSKSQRDNSSYIYLIHIFWRM